jgi:hypothetical protein
LVTLAQKIGQEQATRTRTTNLFVLSLLQKVLLYHLVLFGGDDEGGLEAFGGIGCFLVLRAEFLGLGLLCCWRSWQWRKEGDESESAVLREQVVDTID